jgi:hypothetical protein
MNFAAVIDALEIPAQALVEQRVPKKMLADHGAPTPADKRQIQEGIEEIVWVAALKPTNIGVPAFQDALRQYLEIEVLTVRFRPTAKPQRIIELVHRAIPYPLILIAGHGDTVTLSLAHKRWSQGEDGKVVVENVRRTAPLGSDMPTPEEALFLSSLGITRLPTLDLLALYQGWLDRLIALEASRITGTFTPPSSSDRAGVLLESLADHSQLQREIAKLRVQAEKEKQLNRRVQLNQEIKKLQARLAEAKTRL